MACQEAVNGAVEIVLEELNNALASNNYFLFTVDSPDVDPDYLAMVLSSEPVLKQLSFYKRGIARPRVTIEDILSLVIPLPIVEEQKRLVTNLKKKVKQVQMIQNDLEKKQKEFSKKLFGE
jgi:restriction endonuclease S subunit